MGGALDDGSENAPLAKKLAANFTVFNFARRGRGASSDTKPYNVQREVEDIAALIAVAGGSAHVYGVSSGGMFAFEAAAAGIRINRLAVYEVPYDPSDDAPLRYREYRSQLDTALLGGRRGDAVTHFMRARLRAILRRQRCPLIGRHWKHWRIHLHTMQPVTVIRLPPD